MSFTIALMNVAVATFFVGAAGVTVPVALLAAMMIAYLLLTVEHL